MDYTLTIGNNNELQCMSSFIQLRYDCSIPFGNSSKYDFIADINGKLIRILCKSSNFVRRNGEINTDAFCFSTCCTTTNTKKITRYTYNTEQIDYFATHFQGHTYIIPVNECSTNKTLRFSPPKNGCNNYCKAEDYLITNYFLPSNQYKISKEKYDNRIVLTSEGELKVNEISKKDYYCPICGLKVKSKGVLCSNCAHTLSRKTIRPSREELKNLIKTTPFTKIGILYNVSDNAIRKWCKSYNLPFRSKEITSISDIDWQNI